MGDHAPGAGIPGWLEQRVLDLIEETGDEPGRRVALRRLLEEHPEHAWALRQWLGPLGLLPEAGPAPGARFGPYRIERELGRGGMGVVYLAHHEVLGRRVALKVLPWHFSGDPEARARFHREAKAVAKLRHPSIVPIHEVGEVDGVPYSTMEYVEGANLQQVLAELRRRGVAPGRLAAGDVRQILGGGETCRAGGGSSWPKTYVELVCRIVLDVAEALAHAHGHGVVHRDVKPSNILVGRDGAVRLHDFGLARLAAEAGTTRPSLLPGTPQFIPPEQIRGSGDADGRGDVYALGVTLFELLALRPLFQGSFEQVCHQTVHRLPPAPRSLNPNVPADVETIGLTALEKEPVRRYASAAALADDLRRFLEFRPILARPAGPLTRTRRWVRRNRATAAALALGALALVGIPSAVAVVQARSASRLAAEEARTRRQAAETGFQTARLAGQRGQWVLAQEHFGRALELGYEDPVACEIGILEAREGLMEQHVAMELAQELLDRPDLAPGHRAKLLLVRGDLTSRATDPEAGLEDVREALASGHLDGGDRWYARSLLAETVPEAREALEHSLKLDGYHRRANLALGNLLVLTGARAEARSFAGRFRAMYPQDHNAIFLELSCLALDGSAQEARRLLAEMEEDLPQETREGIALALALFSGIDELGAQIIGFPPGTERPSIGSVLRLLGPPLGLQRRRTGTGLRLAIHPAILAGYRTYVQGVASASLGLPSAVPLLEDAARRNAEPLVLMTLGQVCLERGLVQEAEAAFVQAMDRPGLFRFEDAAALAAMLAQRDLLLHRRPPQDGGAADEAQREALRARLRRTIEHVLAAEPERWSLRTAGYAAALLEDVPLVGRAAYRLVQAFPDDPEADALKAWLRRREDGPQEPAEVPAHRDQAAPEAGPAQDQAPPRGESSGGP